MNLTERKKTDSVLIMETKQWILYNTKSELSPTHIFQ